MGVIGGGAAIHNEMTDKDFWLTFRQALLLMVDAIERMLDIRPRTCELRKEAKK